MGSAKRFKKLLIWLSLFCVILLSFIDDIFQIENVLPDRQMNVEKPVEGRLFHRHQWAEKYCKLKYGYYGNFSVLAFDSPAFSWNFIDERFGIMFCLIPKVGSTNWKDLFQRAVEADKSNSNSSQDLIRGFPIRFMYRMKDLAVPMREHMFNKLKKIIFVRDPLERLISAWRNRIVWAENPEHVGIAEGIVAKYRPFDQMSKFTGSKSNRPTLEEFLRFVGEEGVTNDDEHWRRVMRHCEPCAMGYDFIGKFEHLEEESKFFITKYLKNPLPYKAPAPGSIDVDLGIKSNQKRAEHFIANISVPILQKALRPFLEDYALFNYDLPHFMMKN